MAGPTRSPLVSVPTVAIVHGFLCVATLVAAAIATGGRAPGLGPVAETGPGATLLAPLIVGVGMVALVGLVVTTVRGDAPDGRRTVPRDEAPLGESEVRAVLERWYPDWEPAYRNRVAAAIAYHRRWGRSH